MFKKQNPRDRNLKAGDVIFFKECTREMKRDAMKIRFKGGTGFAVMLGVVPPNYPPPVEAHLMMLMGSAGYLSFDDVANFFGEAIGKECVKKFEEKYYPKSKLILPKEADPLPVPSKLSVVKPEPETTINNEENKQ